MAIKKSQIITVGEVIVPGGLGGLHLEIII